MKIPKRKGGKNAVHKFWNFGFRNIAYKESYVEIYFKKNAVCSLDFSGVVPIVKSILEYFK